ERGAGLGQGRARLLGEVIKDRKLEGLTSSDSKVGRRRCAAVSPREGLRTLLASLSRYSFD
ncbi:unnamed protein product, partial [Linum tenue]